MRSPFHEAAFFFLRVCSCKLPCCKVSANDEEDEEDEFMDG